MLPERAIDPNERPGLLKMLKEVDINHDGRLDFSEYLRLMRQLRNLREYQTFSKEQRAIARTLFTKDEVEDFRHIFLERVRLREADHDDVREIRLSDITRLFGKPGDISPADTLRLADEFQAVTGLKRGRGIMANTLPVGYGSKADVKSAMKSLYQEVYRIAEARMEEEEAAAAVNSYAPASSKTSWNAQRSASVDFSAIRKLMSQQDTGSHLPPPPPKRGADFPEFLLLMRRLIDINFAGIASGPPEVKKVEAVPES